jgi:hypothetical protein
VASRTQLTGTWIINLPMDVVRQRLQTFFLQHGMKKVSEQAGESVMLTVEQGSQVTTRMIGALFVDPAQLPKQAVINLRLVENGVSIETQIGETLGFGLFDPGTQGRYEDYFRRWLGNLMAVLPPVAGTQSSSAPGDVTALPAGSSVPGGTPAPVGPSVTMYHAAKSRGTAFALEILLGLLGIPGIGWIYSGQGLPGVLLLVGWMMWTCIALVLIIASYGIALLCTIPVNFLMVLVSTLLLHNYLKSHQEEFGA